MCWLKDVANVLDFLLGFFRVMNENFVLCDWFFFSFMDRSSDVNTNEVLSFTI